MKAGGKLFKKFADGWEPLWNWRTNDIAFRRGSRLFVGKVDEEPAVVAEDLPDYSVICRSPDGLWLAYAGQSAKTPGLILAPVKGGETRRLASEVVITSLDWTE